MRKEFRIILDTNQSDVQCRLAFEHAVGELTSNRPELIQRVLEEPTNMIDKRGKSYPHR